MLDRTFLRALIRRRLRRMTSAMSDALDRIGIAVSRPRDTAWQRRRIRLRRNALPENRMTRRPDNQPARRAFATDELLPEAGSD